MRAARLQEMCIRDRAGVDVIDCAMSPFALGTSQPATEVMVETFRGTPYDTGYDPVSYTHLDVYKRQAQEDAV